MTTRSETVGTASERLETTPDDPAGAGGPGALDLRGFLRVLRWRYKWVAALAILAVAITAGALALVPPKYKATTIVLLDPRQPRVTNSEAVLSGIGSDAAAVESQVELIQSSALAEKVIAALNLSTDPEFIAPTLADRVREGLLSLVGREPDNSPQARLSRLVDRFESGLTVARRGLTYILEISYSSKVPAKARLISGTLANTYLDDQRSAKSDLTVRASDWLGTRITEIRERLRKSERAVADYKSAHKIVDVTQGNKLIARQIEDATQQLALARSRKAEAGGRLQRLDDSMREGGDPAALGEVLLSPVIANLRAQYAEAARLEAEYSALYGNKHPQLVAVRAQLADIRQQINREIGRVSDGIRNDYRVAASREATLEAELTNLKQQSESAVQADVRLRELEREAQANRTLFEQFLNRAKETNEQESLKLADARVVSPALTPTRPERPSALLLLIVAATGGAILGIGLVLLAEQLRHGLRSAQDVERWLGLPGLGTLPRYRAKAGWRKGVAPASPSTRLVVNAPLSDYAAGLWMIATRLWRTAPATGEVLAVVSALPEEGKSTFAANLALATATSGLRTLLVDGDVYRAALTRDFHVKGPGLCEVLEGKAKLAAAIVKDSKSGLSVLGARASLAAHDAPRDLDVKGVAALLREHRDQFDLIVIDSAAILPVDGGELIACADRAVLVVEWNRTDRDAVRQAIAMLGDLRRKLVGVVLNKASPQWYRSFDYGRYLQEPGAGPAGATRSVVAPVKTAA
jgi:capsular exopolysaccharide synthesis family protein